MRFILVALVLSACAPSQSPGHPRPVNVAAIRHEIQQAEPDGRPIVSMGHVTDTQAVVYTQTDRGRSEETWVRDGSGWKLSSSQRLAGDL